MKNIWFVIANPTSGNNKLSNKWEEIKAVLKQQNIAFEYAITNDAKHAVELVSHTIKKGYRKIISVGGDGTLHSVVNGIMMQNIVKSSEITVGVIPLGTGNDWIKTHNIPEDIKKSIALISKEKTFTQDIGLLELKDTSVYFNNIVGIGFDGYVVKKLNNSKNVGTFTYLKGGILGLLNYKQTNFTITTDTKTFTTKCLMTLIGLGNFYGGGLQMIDNNRPKNGKFGVTIAKNITFIDAIFLIKRLFNGTLFSHKKIQTLTTKSIIITPPKNTTIYTHTNGELVGTGKIKITLLEKAINFVVA